MAELDFEVASLEEIITAYFSDGCVLLHKFVTPLHFTHALPTMTQRRGSIELRFVSEWSLGEITEMHSKDDRCAI